MRVDYLAWRSVVVRCEVVKRLSPSKLDQATLCAQAVVKQEPRDEALRSHRAHRDTSSRKRLAPNYLSKMVTS